MFHIRDMVLDDLSAAQTILENTPTDWTISILKDCFGDDYSHYVILDNNNIVGFIVLKMNRYVWEILQIVIDKTCQRQGLARQLIEYTVEQAKKRNVEKIQLEVRRSNTSALALYQRAGFCEVGMRKRYYSDGEDAVLMDRQL